MSKAMSIARWTSAVFGGALVVAFQTPPDTAVSNAAQWIEKITGHLPDFPPWADALGTAVGLLLVVLPLAFWLRKRRRKKGWTDRGLDALTRIMSGQNFSDRARERSLQNKADIVADISSGAFRNTRGRSEGAPGDQPRKNSALSGPSNESSDWVTLSQALRYLVYESYWATQQPSVGTEEEFNRLVAGEARERLARGEIRSRGQLGWDDESRDRATEPIPAEYWVESFFLPFGAIALGDNSGCEVAKRGGGGAVYRGVILRWSDVKRAWRKAVSSTNHLTPLAAFVESARAKIEAEGREAKRGGILAAMNDEMAEQQDKFWSRLGAVLPPAKVNKLRAGGYRDCGLPDALGWAVYGKWDKPFHGTPTTAAFAAGLGIGTDIRKLLDRFSELAAEGKLTIWGKRDSPGYYEQIPQDYWHESDLTLGDVFGGVTTTGGNPYRSLMLNKSEVQRAWPHEG